MFPLVNTNSKNLEDYKKFSSKQEISQIKKLSKNISSLKIYHLNSVSQGGGVAEVLKNLVPLMKGLGLETEWYTIPPEEKFFNITKKMHNSLQGVNFKVSKNEREEYKRYLKKASLLLKDMNPDIWVIHDPQPLGLIDYIPKEKITISRIHIDTTQPNLESWNFIYPYLKKYDKIVFTSKEFIKEDVPPEKTMTFTPAIDPLNPKNQPMNKKEAEGIVSNFGINLQKPLISQVSRFDYWKDPIGVLKAFRIAKKEIPGLQLALVGIIRAKDDPEAIRRYNEVKREAEKDKDIFLFSNPKIINFLGMSKFINSLQTASDIIIQKSIREGFGLTVTEAMWKKKAVIASNVGGIKLQIKNGKSGFLVSSPEQTAQRIIQLVKNPDLIKKIGENAKKTVSNDFLITRLLKDYLKLFNNLVNK